MERTTETGSSRRTLATDGTAEARRGYDGAFQPDVPRTDRARVRFHQSQHVRAEPEAIFPLLCPVREFDWIPSWDCDIVYTESGVAEEGCVFQTDPAGDAGPDTWVISRYEPAKRVSFVRVNRLRTIRYDIFLEPDGDGSTTLRWEQEITALSEDDFAATIATIERMMQHYLETGEALGVEYSGT